MIYRFEDFQLDTDAFELRRAEVAVETEPQVFGVLWHLISRAGQLATKEDLLAAVWGTTYVSDAALNTRIKQARQALGDDGQQQRLIKTVHGRGYRFVGRLDAREPSDGSSHSRETIGFCKSSDGVTIAYAVTGSGPPFVKVANWLTHVDHDSRSPVWGHLIRELSRDFTLARYDQRGCGLSDRDVDEGSYSVDAWTRDLEAVADHLGWDRFPVFGISQGGAVAIAYAAAHPDRVSHLILHGSFARGRDQRGPEQAEVSRALAALTADAWGNENSAHARMFAERLIPAGSDEQLRWLVELQRASVSRENAVRFRRAFGALSVEDLLPRIRVPTLVLHSTRDQSTPIEEGRRIAAAIPDAAFLPLDSDNHLVLEDEPAWPRMLAAIRDFTGANVGSELGAT